MPEIIQNFELLNAEDKLGAYEKVNVNGIEKEKIIRTGILVSEKGYIIKI